MCYYGKSVNLSKRKIEHFRQLRGKNHRNRHLQNAFDKYGEDCFNFKVILYCEEFELSRYETFFINKESYNICKESSETTLGIKYTPEQKKKLSNINKEKGNPMWGKNHSEETKKKMSEKALLKNNMRGKEYTPEEKRKLSKMFSGENNPRAKLSKDDVLWIRENGKDLSLKELAKKYNMSIQAISNIKTFKSWKEGANHSCGNIGQNGDIR